MSKVILFNAAKGAGKSVACSHLLQKYANSTYARCKDKLFELTMSLFNVPEDVFWKVYEDRVEKELPNRLFTVTAEALEYLEGQLGYDDVPYAKVGTEYWLSCRHAMIYVSECICKPAFGEDYFGKARADSITGEFDLYLDDSLGFAEELKPLVDKVGAENILIIRVHGRGDFQGDSRSIIEDSPLGIKSFDIPNEGTIEEFLKLVDNVVEEFYEH